MRLLVSVGARARAGGRLAPVVAVLDLTSWRWAGVWSVVPPVGPPDGDHVGAGFLVDDRLVVPTRSAIVELDAGGQLVAARTHPLLFDVHAVAPAGDGGLLVASTGNETIVQLGPTGEAERVWELGAPVDRGRDYRTLHHRALKPHRAHPNHVVAVGPRLVVTRLTTADLVDLHDPAFRIPIPEGAPHDGRLRDGLLWVTTVNGHVIGVDPDTGARAWHVDLAAADPGAGLAGWCRGIAVGAERIWVGVSQLRHAGWREAARRAIRGASGHKRPARIVEIDRTTRRVTRTLPLPFAGGAEIYGLTAAGVDGAGPG